MSSGGCVSLEYLMVRVRACGKRTPDWVNMGAVISTLQGTTLLQLMPASELCLLYNGRHIVLPLSVRPSVCLSVWMSRLCEGNSSYMSQQIWMNRGINQDDDA
jgi:hypothetical protein